MAPVAPDASVDPKVRDAEENRYVWNLSLIRIGKLSQLLEILSLRYRALHIEVGGPAGSKNRFIADSQCPALSDEALLDEGWQRGKRAANSQCPRRPSQKRASTCETQRGSRSPRRERIQKIHASDIASVHLS